MTITIDEFRKYLQIDKNSLDEEIIKQPSLSFEVAEAYIQAAARRDALKEKLATIDAELDAEIREDFENNSVKITEALVKNTIQCHKDHEIAAKAYFAVNEQANLWQALKDAFHQRSYMLRDLVSLHTANYFESASARGDARSDKFVYNETRDRLADARSKRVK